MKSLSQFTKQDSCIRFTKRRAFLVLSWYIDSYGRTAVVKHSASLAGKAWDGLANAGFQMLAPRPGADRAPIICFALRGNTTSVTFAAKLFQQYGIVAKADSEIVMVDLAFGDDFFKQNRSWDDFGTIISGI